MPGLESEDARAALAAMPTAEQLMPALSLDDLGVKTWQPPEGAAAALLEPSTPADRKRRKVRQAIEANPGASDREVARIAGCDHKTVAAIRRAAAGELPAGGGDFPAVGGGFPTTRMTPCDAPRPPCHLMEDTPCPATRPTR